MTTLYRYNPSTKFLMLVGPVEQQLDVISGDLVPIRNTTDKEPLPEKEGYVCGFVTGEWEYYVDNRGTEYWAEDGTKHTITEVGEEVQEGALLEAPVILPTNAELSTTARTKRDQLLGEVSKRYDRYASESRLGLETTDSIESLDTYAQALRDITKQEGFPTTIEWPALPT
ncbi:MAG: phage tail assembly chaperone [Marinomonas foliarum]|uniref:phage tail assembly chaperone n=1 Tax=Marinomonas foliarum TaxID=491950 RepID=UPI003F9AEA07